jgi:hypothetical protein
LGKKADFRQVANKKSLLGRATDKKNLAIFTRRVEKRSTRAWLSGRI